MNEPSMKLLYIAGWGRSGSTVLARIFGQLEGFFHGGELRTIWVDGMKPNGTCGCGVLVKECEVWKTVFDRAFGGMDKVDPKAMTHLRRSSEPRTQEVLLSLLFPPVKQKLQARLQEYLSVLEQLYDAVQAVTHSRAIVDDSLHPGYAYTLSLLPNVDLYIVHIIRDPRATGYSWWKRRKKGLGTYTIRQNALGWDMRNLVVEALGLTMQGKYLRLLYEDFIAQPQAAVRQILDFMGETPPSLPFVSEHAVTLDINHSVFGNPNRSETGAIQLQLDDEWQRKIDPGDRRTTNLLTFPLLWRYGYWFGR